MLNLLRLFVAVLLFLAMVLPATAQSDADKKRFEEGKQLLREGKYGYAGDAFRTLVASAGAVNAFTPEADYYYALSLYKSGMYKPAELAITTALKKSGSNFKNEGNYLLACILLAQQQYSNGIALLQPITDAQFTTDIAAAKKFYLAAASLDTLKTLRKRYPADYYLGLALTEKLAGGDVTAADRDLARELATRYSSAALALKLDKVPASFKGSYKVAVLLPLNLNQTDFKVAARPNQVIYDLLQGIKYGAEVMADSGINLQLYVYDTEKSEAKVKLLLGQPEMKGMDMVLGPVAGAGAKQLSVFADSNHIPMINPISNKLYWGNDNRYAWLAGSTYESEAFLAADFALKNLKNEKVGIIFGADAQDSIQAKQYRDAITSGGGKVVMYRKTAKNSAANLVKFIAEAGLDSTGHIYAPNNEPLVRVQLVGALALLNRKSPVVTHSEWLNASNISLSQYERTQFYFTASRLVNTGNPAYMLFNKNYKARYSLPPSQAAAEGYDITYVVAKAFEQGGRQIANTLQNTGFHKGVLFTGYDFSHGPQNAFVPVYKLENGELVLVNR